MYYEDLLETVVDDSESVSVSNSKQKKTNIVNKNNNYVKYTIPFNNTWTDGKYYSNVLIENYGSSCLHGKLIRNAVSGSYYNILTGSSDEDLLFKVIDSTGYGRNKRREPIMLYYDSPEEYENHHFTLVSPAIKEKWKQKSSKAERQRKTH